jgi:hypothetical protein
MSAYGPKQTFCDCGLESAFGGKADIDHPLLVRPRYYEYTP